MPRIKMNVNGEEKVLDIGEKESLLSVLRDRLDLKGAKEGCGYGACGSCTVLVDGKPVTSCTFRGAAKMDGIKVLTIEGLYGPDGTLHPIQKAFIDAGAVQCGFCTPGMVLKLYWLFGENPNATEDEIKKALEKHLCRCTGYEAIMRAALFARDILLGHKVDIKPLECERVN